VYLCVLCGSEDKERLFPYTTLTDWFYNRDLTLYSPVVTICTASLTCNNSTLCPHSVFMCFVWISEQTTIISLYNINLLVFITETESVYCAVQTGSPNACQINRDRVTFVVEKSGSWTGFSPVTLRPTPHTNYIYIVLVRKGQTAEA